MVIPMADNKKAASAQLKTAITTLSHSNDNIILPVNQAHCLKKYTSLNRWIKSALPWWSRLLGQEAAQKVDDLLRLATL